MVPAAAVGGPATVVVIVVVEVWGAQGERGEREAGQEGEREPRGEQEDSGVISGAAAEINGVGDFHWKDGGEGGL